MQLRIKILMNMGILFVCFYYYFFLNLNYWKKKIDTVVQDVVNNKTKSRIGDI